MHVSSWCCVLLLSGAAAGQAEIRAVKDPGRVVVADVGFATPECVLHEPAHDVYLVSNVHGSPFAKDDNGFISRVKPDGRVETLKWIDGAAADVTLHAPKGMVLLGDLLVVADIDTVRFFARDTGRPAGEIAVPGATFLNGIAASPHGGVIVTDSGFKPAKDGFGASGSDAIWSVEWRGKPERIATSPKVARPNGVVETAYGIYLVTWETGELQSLIDEDLRTLARLPKAQLDGLVNQRDGSWLVSSWEGRCVYRVAGDRDADGKPTTRVAVVASDLESPAAIGVDTRRNRLLVPLFTRDALVIMPLPATR